MSATHICPSHAAAQQMAENSQAKKASVKCPVTGESDEDLDFEAKCKIRSFDRAMLLLMLFAVSFMLIMQYKIYNDMKTTGELKVKEAVKRACESVAKSSEN